MDDSRLRTAFNFSRDDLDANQHGYMTKEQRVRLRNKRWEKIAPYAICAGFFFFIFLCGLTSTGSRSGLPRDPLAGLGLMMCIFVPATVVIASFGYREWQKIKADLYKGDVSTLRGCVGLHIESAGRGGLVCKARIGGVEFGISKEQLLAFRNGEPYNIYFAPNSKIILSAEPI